MQWHKLSLKSKSEESLYPEQPYPPHKCDLGSGNTQYRLPQPSLSVGNLSTGKVGFVWVRFAKRANLAVQLSGAVATQQTYLAFVGWVEPKAKPNVSMLRGPNWRFRLCSEFRRPSSARPKMTLIHLFAGDVAG